MRRRREVGDYSDENFLDVLELALFYGFLGIHRIYVGKKLSGILYIVNFIAFLIVLFFGRLKLGFSFKMLAFLILALILHITWLVDVILIVSGKFKDKDRRIISNVIDVDYNNNKMLRNYLGIYNMHKVKYKKDIEKITKKMVKDVEEPKENSNFSDKNVVILYFLTGIGEKKLASFFLGLYKFYSGNYKGGFLNVGVNLLTWSATILCVLSRCKIIWVAFMIYVILAWLIFYPAAFRDRCKILGGEYKDSTGKKICLTHI